MTKFDNSVFINCPFDREYTSNMLRPIIFTLIYLGYDVRIALECGDSERTRIDKIANLIRESKFSIHDLSRIESSKDTELFRLNMAFELGLDFGCKKFSEGELKDKKILILETERYRYQAALSDISGSDIKAHSDKPEEVIRIIREWFSINSKDVDFGAQKIWDEYTMGFNTFLYESKKEKGFSDSEIDNISIVEYIRCIKDWKV